MGADRAEFIEFTETNCLSYQTCYTENLTVSQWACPAKDSAKIFEECEHASEVGRNSICLSQKCISVSFIFLFLSSLKKPEQKINKTVQL